MAPDMPTDGRSSPEEYDDDSNMPPETQWSPHGQPNSDDPASPSSAQGATASASRESKFPPPMQKRRRVTRACDECRRKKIKCDGKQPCTHCTVYSYECTYDQPSNRRRNPAPQYIEALEHRLHRAEALLKTVLPDVDLDDPRIGHSLPPNLHFPGGVHVQASRSRELLPSEIPSAPAPADEEAEKDSLLESMVQSTGSLDLDDRGYWDFHGHSSGIIFLRRMRQQFGDLMGAAEGHGAMFLQTTPMTQIFDSPRSATDSPMDPNGSHIEDLPSKDCARELCEVALDDACALMRFVHQPTFYAMFDRIFDTDAEQYGKEENTYLPLVYAVIAVGCLFAKNENSKLQLEGYETARERGFQYFKASRQMMDITDCRDLPSLQAIIFLIMFLQSSAKLATCYSYIGVALHSAVRMGLHRSIKSNFNPIERQTRKLIFWQVRKMDLYVGALLGLPVMLSDDDIDQELPQEIDDVFVTATKVLPQPLGKVPLLAATNAHTRLTKVLQKVVRYIYPLKGLEFAQNPNRPGQSYVVSHAKIREIEQDLQAWMEGLPMGLRPGGEVSPELSRVQQLLRMSYAHVQMVLYRPFLHYASQPYQKGSVDRRSYACAAACVSVSRNVIHITVEMKKRGLLIGAYWFTMYTTFFAILSLIFYVLENPNSSTSQDILRDANEGKEVLASLAKRSMAADRCTITLASLFNQLPEKLGRRATHPTIPPRKRHADSPNPILPNRTSHSSPSIGTITENYGSVSRPTVYPQTSSHLAWNRNPAFYPVDAFRRGSHDPYSPSSPDQAVVTPDSASSRGEMPFGTPQQGSYGLPAGYGLSSGGGGGGGRGGGLLDLSAMMFPSEDPFAYPNQPMTTLENRHPHFSPNMSSNVKSESSFPGTLGKEGDGHSVFEGPVGVAGGGAGGRYEMSGVQLYGPLPPYLMQGQHPGMGMPNGGAGVAMEGSGGEGMAMGEEGWVPGQGGGPEGRSVLAPGVGTPGMEELFGEDWKRGWTGEGVGFGVWGFDGGQRGGS